MTDPISPVAASGFLGDQGARSAPMPTTAADSTKLEVSRAAEAPIYVYRVLDSQTGRTLVEIPRESQASRADRLGATLDTRV